MADLLARLSRTLDGHGLLFRGGFYPGPRDRVPGETGTLVLVGNAGPDLWRVFAHHRRDEPHPLDAWTRRVLTGVGRRFDARILFPFGGPPYHPFQRWARRAEAVYPSPIGPLIHPEYGLWHAYRGALAFTDKIALPPKRRRANPCQSCRDRPCLGACPVDAFQRRQPMTYRPASPISLRTPAGPVWTTDAGRASPVRWAPNTPPKRPRPGSIWKVS